MIAAVPASSVRCELAIRMPSIASIDRQRHLLHVLERAQQVLLRDVRDLVREHGRELVLARHVDDQSRIRRDVAAGNRERVDLVVAHDEERERQVRPVAVGDELVAERVDVFVEQRIVEHVAVGAQLVQHAGAVFALVLRRHDRARRAADVGQLDVEVARAREARDAGGGQKCRDSQEGHTEGSVVPKAR